MWKSIEKHKTPERMGIYVVARFEGDKMVEWSDNYVFYEGGWSPNNIGDPTAIVRNFTHWMSYADFRSILERTPRE